MIPPKTRLPAPPPAPITLAKVLMTEGETPTHFCEALLLHLGLSNSIEVRNFGGVTNLNAVLAALAATAEFHGVVTSLGIIRDAETDAAHARHEVVTAVAAARLSPHVQTSVFILPDNARPGMIETLCQDAVRAHPLHTQINGCIDAFFDCAVAGGVDLPDPMRQVKNWAQAFLATRRESQMFPGIAAYRGFWPWDSTSFDPLKDFLRNL